MLEVQANTPVMILKAGINLIPKTFIHIKDLWFNKSKHNTLEINHVSSN
jgi:hypothetical protein